MAGFLSALREAFSEGEQQDVSVGGAGGGARFKASLLKALAARDHKANFPTLPLSAETLRERPKRGGAQPKLWGVCGQARFRRRMTAHPSKGCSSITCCVDASDYRRAEPAGWKVHKLFNNAVPHELPVLVCLSRIDCNSLQEHRGVHRAPAVEEYRKQPLHRHAHSRVYATKQ